MRVIWGYFELYPEDARALDAGEALLGLSHRYFTSVDPTLVVGRLVVKRSELPSWVCVDCSPQWSDLSRLASLELRASSSTIEALREGLQEEDLTRLAMIRGEQERLEMEHLPKYERLLRELVPPESQHRLDA
ncbi:hypothetical protein [Aquisphaera giovannonii]|uniref:hypothetical protein n=1 Tax=Aquisphaera giovannonii TaxID=406548 RepID=UPI001AEFC189|nr:hypothetical protein [Aquisphaera giovannonii]